MEDEILDKIAKALDIPVEAITEIDNGNVVNIITGTWNDSSAVNHYTFNPIDKIVELYDGKIALYERMLKEKDSVNELLQEVVREKR